MLVYLYVIYVFFTGSFLSKNFRNKRWLLQDFRKSAWNEAAPIPSTQEFYRKRHSLNPKIAQKKSVGRYEPD